MKRAIVYIHGQGGSPAEAQHYSPLFPGWEIIGLAYRAQTPWEAAAEFPILFRELCGQYDAVTVIANSIGAYFAMHALADRKIQRAYFISPVVDMQKLIERMMHWANVSRELLQEKGEIETPFGQTLSWDYLTYVQAHPVHWEIPTRILYGSTDHLVPYAEIAAFARETGAEVTVMENGEHWFHTEEQMHFLDQWLQSERREEA